MDGVDFHAQMLDGFLQNRVLVPYKWENIEYKVYICILSLLVIFISVLLPGYMSMIFTVLFLVFLLWTSRYIYFQFGIVADTLPLLLAG